ncbi:MAG TPA: hypothetical protein VEK75_02910, partial [Xanthobacteraceae bacterium]|nr:hypothetical protein [Xanthobacteraceae bacterium]
MPTTAQSDADALDYEDSRNRERGARASEHQGSGTVSRETVSIEEKLRQRPALPPHRGWSSCSRRKLRFGPIGTAALMRRLPAREPCPLAALAVFEPSHSPK